MLFSSKDLLEHFLTIAPMFTCFPELLPELRQQIWEHTNPEALVLSFNHEMRYITIEGNPDTGMESTINHGKKDFKAHESFRFSETAKKLP